MVALAVIAGRVAGPRWGGVVASFPVAFSSAAILLAKYHPPHFVNAVMKSMIRGSATNVLFVMVIYGLTARLGVAIAMTVAYLAVLVFAAAIYFGGEGLERRKAKVVAG